MIIQAAMLIVSCANLDKGHKKSASLSAENEKSTIIEIINSASTSVEADFFNLQISCPNLEDQSITYTAGESRVITGYTPSSCTLSLKEFKLTADTSTYLATNRNYNNGQVFENDTTLMLVTSKITETRVCTELDSECKFNKVKVEVEISEILNETIDFKHSIIIDECEVKDGDKSDDCDSPGQNPGQNPGQSENPHQN
jgi:hypothetical protein